MAKTKAKPEEAAAQEDTTRNERISRIIDKLKGAAPSLAELDEWAATEPPEPTFGDMAFNEKKKKKAWLL